MKTLRLSLFTRIFFVTLLLLGFGLLMIYSASVSEGLRDFGNKWHFVQLQLKWAGLGLLFLSIASLIPPRTWKHFAPHLLGLGLILLVVVLIPGIGSRFQGARRWLSLPGITLQPAELIKFLEIVYLSSWLSSRKVTLLQFLTFMATIAGLIMLEPDMGTTIVVTTIALALYFLSGYPLVHLATLGVGGLLVGSIMIFSSTYRLERVKTFLDPAHDPSGSAYHIRQVTLALGSGGITGVGIGKSRQKYEYLPESTTDSIFAVVAEELGFLGSLSLIALFVYLITLVFRVASEARDPYASLLAGGVGAWITIQVTLNLAAMVAIAPLTGVPLPLVSYGGSSLITVLLGLGAVLSVARSERI